MRRYLDERGKSVGLHYIRTKDGTEVDFALSEENALTHLIECKHSDTSPHRALTAFSARFPNAEAIQLVRDLRQEEQRGTVRIAAAAHWLRNLDA